MKFLKELPWRGYIISGIITTLGSSIIYLKQSYSPSMSEFIMWLPLTWLLLFIFMVFFVLFLGEKK